MYLRCILTFTAAVFLSLPINVIITSIIIISITVIFILLALALASRLAQLQLLCCRGAHRQPGSGLLQHLMCVL